MVVGERKLGRSTARKLVALAAVGAVVGVGVYSTLASWNDNEWVVAGLDGEGDPDVRTSDFEVQQNREQSPSLASTFEDRETNDVAGDLEFDPGELALAPGDTIYAPVALRTTATSLAGAVTLQAPVASATLTAQDPAGMLWQALTYSVKTSATASDCTEATWAGFGTDVAVDVALTEPLVAPSQNLAAAAGAVQYYCFAITLPDPPTLPVGTSVDELQGRSVHPAWRFASVSS